MFVRSFALLCLFVACAPPGAGGDAPGPEAKIEIPSFRVAGYHHRLSLEAGVLETTLAIDVPAPGGSCLTLPSLLAAFSGQWNGADAWLAHDGAMLQWCGAAVGAGPLVVSSTQQLREERDDVGAGFIRRLDARGNRFTYLQSWLERCPRFGPCDDRIGAQFTFEMEVEHDADEVVLCPGTRTTTNGRTRCVIDEPMAPTYSAIAVMANREWRPKTLLSNAQAEVTLYEVPGGQLASAIDVPSLASFIEWITDLLGPLPYGRELRIVSAPLQWMGFEHPANIIVNEELPSLQTPYGDETAHTLMHEIVHQWAGNRTTMAGAVDVVWKEAIPEYLTYVFEEERRSAQEAASSRAYWKQVGRFAPHWPVPHDQPPPPLSVLLHNAYGAGTMTLFVQLKPFVGRAALLAAIQSFLSQPGVKGVEELLASIQAAAGRDLSPYFDAWVRGVGEPRRPELNVFVREGAVHVRQTQDGAVMPCVVEIDVGGETQTQRLTARFELDASERELVLPLVLGEPFQWLEVDPDHRLMALVRRRPPMVAAERVWRL